jgi:hypothetical protein
MKTRSQKKNIIPRVYTKSVISLNFAKCEDTKNSIKNLINDAKTNLNKCNCVIISLVIPDSYYKDYKNDKYNKYIHQGHTFAVTIDNENLLLYDNSYKDPYYSKKKYWKNYQFVIDQLKEHRKIVFFPLNYAQKNKFKSLLNEEGICFEYIKELEENNIILPPKICFKIIKNYL